MVRSNRPTGGDGRPQPQRDPRQEQDPRNWGEQGWQDPNLTPPTGSPGLSSYQQFPQSGGVPQDNQGHGGQTPQGNDYAFPDHYATQPGAQGGDPHAPGYDSYAHQPPQQGQPVFDQPGGFEHGGPATPGEVNAGQPNRNFGGLQPDFGADPYAHTHVPGTATQVPGPAGHPAPMQQHPQYADYGSGVQDQWADVPNTGEPQLHGQPEFGAYQAGHEGTEPAFSDWNHAADPYGQHVGGQAGGYDAAGNYIPAEGEAGYGGEEYYEEEYEEAPRSSRKWMILGVLGAAIATGGALTFAYQTVLGPTAKSGSPPVVKGDAQPAKMRPDDPGGRKFAHTDSKMMGRLGDGGGTAGASSVGADGSKKVPTLVIGRDGSIQTPTASVDGAPSPDVSGAASGGIPGMVVVDTFGAGGTEPPSGERRPPPQEPLVITPSAGGSAQPPKVTNPAPDTATKKPVEIAKVTPEPKAPQPPPSVPEVEKPTPEATAPAPSSGPAWTTSGAGYVPVLASVPVSSSSRINALKQYADITSKYGSVLAGKTPDVREANLGAKGKYHRLLAGPPVSREQAIELCKKLKSAGYSSCWVTAY